MDIAFLMRLVAVFGLVAFNVGAMILPGLKSVKYIKESVNLSLALLVWYVLFVL